MNTLVDQILEFRVRQENLNIPFLDFMNKVSNLSPRKMSHNHGDELWLAPGEESSNIFIEKKGNYKQDLSGLIKKHVKSFHQIKWK